MSLSLASVAAPDLTQPAEIVDGRRTYLVRARVPFAFSALLTDARVEAAVRAPVPTIDDEGEGPTDPTNPGEQKIVTKADGEGMAAEEDDTDPATGEGGEMMLYGVASSTGVDTYGTEMSKRALDGMAEQFSSGEVCYLPAHPSWSGNGGEWDSVIGYVTKGEVVSSAVENAAAATEPGFALRVAVALDADAPMAERLAKMIGRKKKVGQSIGGWFTELRYIYAADAGEWDPPERVIIEGVELDHLAATRRPSNGDSWIDGMRSAISASHDSAVARAKAAAPKVVAAEVEPTPEPVAAEPADERNNAVPLDTENAPRHDSDDDAGSEGQRASPGATDGDVPSTNTEELNMTPEALRALLTESLAPIAARLDAVEARTAVATPPGARVADPVASPVADPNATEVAALRARLAASEARTAERYFGRKGHAGAGSFDRAVIEGVAEQVVEQAPALAAVVRSKGFVDRRSVSHYGATIEEQVSMRAALESDLHALINSAVDEGVIREPDSDVGSWS
jgi:hypothetical protein